MQEFGRGDSRYAVVTFTRCRHEAEHYTDELGRISGERRPGNSTPASEAAREGRWGEMRGTYIRPKDSNAAVGVRDRATGKALEGTDRQTDRQTVFPRIIVILNGSQLDSGSLIPTERNEKALKIIQKKMMRERSTLDWSQSNNISRFTFDASLWCRGRQKQSLSEKFFSRKVLLQ